MIINDNVSALQSMNQLNKNLSKTKKAMERLSSGLRIIRAADDAAGLSISVKMNAQIRGLDQAKRNIQDSISLVQIAEDGIGQIIEPPLQRIRELAVQAANDTLTDSDRLQIQKEVDQLKADINDIANHTTFNGIQLLNVPDSEKRLVGPNQFIALTRDGLPLTSKNGVDWEIHSPGSSMYLNEMAFGKKDDGTGIIVAVGDQGRISTSLDGESWSSQSSGTSDLLMGVTYGEGTFVAVGDNGTILASKDGTNWTQENSGTSNRFVGIDYIQGNFIATGFNGTISTSVDGITWGTKSYAGAVGTLRSVASDGQRMIAVGDNGRLYYSDDNGENWIYHQTSVAGNFKKVVHNGERFVAITDANTIETSTNGLNWSQSSVADFQLYDLSWGENVFVAAGGSFTPPKGSVLTSTDGLSWKETSLGAYDYLSTIIWAGYEEEIPLDNHLTFQVGTNTGMSMNLERMNVTSDALGINDLSLTTQSSAEMAIDRVDAAISNLSSKQSQLGAQQNALDYLQQNNSNYELNLNAAYSKITDDDLAKEMMEMTKDNLISQAAQAMLAQSNQMPSQVLQLLK